MFFSAGLAALLFLSNADLPNWISDLRPSLNLGFRWTERLETASPLSEPSMKAKGGIFPKISDHLSLGLQIMATSSPPASSPDSAKLSDGMTNKQVSLRQAALETDWGNFIRWSAVVGKFQNPIFSSPLLWDSEMTPEGLFQSLEIVTNFKVGIYGAQYSVYQQGGSRVVSISRSWLFSDGAYLSYEWNDGSELKFAVNHQYYFKPASSLADGAERSGNSVVGHEFVKSYSPLEGIFSASARPLGIQTSIKAALAANFETDDQQRGFFLEGQLGNAWRPQNFLLALSYYYNEPDLTVSSFTDNRYAFSNRKGPRGEVSYFISKTLRVGASLVYLEALAPSALQSNRRELRAELECLF